MKINGLFLMALIVLIIVSAILCKVNRPAIAQTSPRSALEVLKSRSAWRTLPSGFLNVLASKLNSVEKAVEFAQLCEKTGILKNNIVGLVDDADADPDFALSGVAVTLTSYANTMGNHRQFKQAKQALDLALLLKPRHVSAWASMTLVAFSMKDCKAAVSWADKVLTFKPDPNSKDYWERGAALSMTDEGEKLAAEALGEAEMIGNWKQIQEQMKTIKDACRR